MADHGLPPPPPPPPPRQPRRRRDVASAASPRSSRGHISASASASSPRSFPKEDPPEQQPMPPSPVTHPPGPSPPDPEPQGPTNPPAQSVLQSQAPPSPPPPPLPMVNLTEYENVVGDGDGDNESDDDAQNCTTEDDPNSFRHQRIIVNVSDGGETGTLEEDLVSPSLKYVGVDYSGSVIEEENTQSIVDEHPPIDRTGTEDAPINVEDEDSQVVEPDENNDIDNEQLTMDDTVVDEEPQLMSGDKIHEEEESTGPPTSIIGMNDAPSKDESVPLINLDSTLDASDPKAPTTTEELLNEDDGDDDGNGSENPRGTPDISGGIGSDKSSWLHIESSSTSKGSQGSYAYQVPSLSGSASTTLPPPPPDSTPENRNQNNPLSPTAALTPQSTYHTAGQTIASESDRSDLDDILGANGEPMESDLDDILGQKGETLNATGPEIIGKQSSLEDTLGPYQAESTAGSNPSVPTKPTTTSLELANDIPRQPRPSLRPTPIHVPYQSQKISALSTALPTSPVRTPTQSRRAIEGIGKALADREADQCSSVWTSSGTPVASILPEASAEASSTAFGADTTTAHADDRTAIDFISTATTPMTSAQSVEDEEDLTSAVENDTTWESQQASHSSTAEEEDEDGRSSSWGRSASRYTTSTSATTSHAGDETLSPGTVESSMWGGATSAPTSSRGGDTRYTLSLGASTTRADDEFSPTSTAPSGTFSPDSSAMVRDDTQFSVGSATQFTFNSGGRGHEPTASTVVDATSVEETSPRSWPGETTQTLSQETSTVGAVTLDNSNDVVDATTGSGGRHVLEAVQVQPQGSCDRPLSPQAQKFAETIMARTRSRADPDALVNNGSSATDQNSDKPSSNMVKLTAQDEGLIESTTLARKRVRVVQLLSVGLASFLVAFLGGFWVQSSCYFVSANIQVGENAGEFEMRFGIWKYSPIDSIFQGYTYCSPYNGSNAPLAGQIASVQSLVGGAFSLAALWVYLVLGKCSPRVWKWAVISAGLSGALQLSTLSIFFGSVCRENSCSLGPAGVLSIVVGCFYFLLAYEMHYNKPEPVADQNDGILSVHSRDRPGNLVANLEMTDFEYGAKAYVHRLAFGNSNPYPTLNQVQRQNETPIGGGMMDRDLAKTGSYQPPSVIV